LRLAIDLLLAAWLLSEGSIFVRSSVARVRAGVRSVQDRGSAFVLIVGIVLGTGATRLGLLAPGAAFGELRAPLFWLGIGLGAAGIALRWYAVLTLGRFFRVAVEIQPDHPVVDDGPYRWVRHPSYSGIVLIVIGVLLCSGNWLGFLGLIPVLAGIAYRIAVEERALIEGLGEPYAVYARAHRRLIPHLI
jgi:protein-S-isoprenylcysteine O-methyltransferase Ste14